MACGGGPIFRDEDISTFINKKLVDWVVPKVIVRIIEWGCNKEKHQTFMDFIKKRHSLHWKDYKNRWKNEKDQIKLHKTGFETFDVSFLVKLVPEICDKIAVTGSKYWLIEDDSKVESLLQRIKDLRNLIAHEPSETAISSKTLDKMQQLLVKLLVAANDLYQPKVDVNKEIDDMKRMVKKVRDTLVNRKQQSIFDIQDKLETDCINEIRDVWMNVVNKEVLPFCKVKVVHTDVFHPITLEVPEEFDERPIQFSCENLFQNWSGFDELVNCIVIEGVAGSGKTTLVKRIALDYVCDRKVFRGIEKYSLMVHMECRNCKVETLQQVLARNFPKTLQSLCMEEVISAVQNMRVLFFVDGIDELNKKSRNLVEDLLNMFGMKQDSMLIFTSRPNASKEFRNELDGRFLNYQTLKIKPISRASEQIQFLEKYQAAIPTPQLIKAFQTLTYDRQSHFVYPIFLTLFCHLFRESPNDVDSWTNPRNVMEHTLKLCKDKMIERIPRANSSIVAGRIIDAICDLSFRCLCWNQMSIDQTTYDETCEKFMLDDPNIEYSSVTSCILLTKSSYYTAEEDTYCFFHKSQQEHLASRSVISQLRNPTKSVREAIQEIMEPYPFAQEDLKKVVMALKFTLLEYDTPDKQRRLGTRRDELLDLVQTSGLTSFEDWAQIVCNFPNSEQVASVAAQTAAAEEESFDVVWWEVTNLGQVSAATRMLHHHHPLALKIRLPELWVPPEAPLVALLEAVGKYHKGGFVLELHNHFATFTPADEALLHLYNSECGLVEFHGCLSTVAAAKALAVATGTALSPGLHISLPNPYHHPLMELQGTRHGLYVTVQHCHDDVTGGRYPPKPLPRGSSPPQLTVSNTPKEGADEAQAIFLCLAPTDKRYYRLQLRECHLSDQDLGTMIRTLRAAELHTEDSDGESRWEDAGTLSGECRVCLVETIEHAPGSRCIWLHVTGDALASTKVEEVGKNPDEDSDSDGTQRCKSSGLDSQERPEPSGSKAGTSKGSLGTGRKKGGTSKKRAKKSAKKGEPSEVTSNENQGERLNVDVDNLDNLFLEFNLGSDE